MCKNCVFFARCMHTWVCLWHECMCTCAMHVANMQCISISDAVSEIGCAQWGQLLSSYSHLGHQVWQHSGRSRILKISRFREISRFGQNLGFLPNPRISRILARIAVRSTFGRILARIAILARSWQIGVRTVRTWLGAGQILESPESARICWSDLPNLPPRCYI